MKVILVMVSSLNGKITEAENSSIHHWTSAEDQKYFRNLVQKSQAIVMGRTTYEAARPAVSEAGPLRIIVTKNPENFAQEAIPNKLEFTNKSPEEIFKDLQSRNFTETLLVGGSEINRLFFQAKLIDELWLTVEPILIGTGKPLIADSQKNLKLKLISTEKLNSEGTLLLKYAIV